MTLFKLLALSQDLTRVIFNDIETVRKLQSSKEKRPFNKVENSHKKHKKKLEENKQ